MSRKDTALLVLLGAIWGSSFMFMAILTPVLGPIVTASSRILIGASFLYIYFRIRGIKVNIIKNLSLFMFLGPISLGIPYILFSVAAVYIPSGVSAILNTTAPLFAAILGLVILNDKLKIHNIIGLFIATSGVGIVTSTTLNGFDSSSIIGILAVILATLFYAISGILVKTKTEGVDSNALAIGNQLFGGLLILPLMYFYPITGVITIPVVIYMLIFGIVGSGIAMVIYFYLMKTVGPVKTLAVTYLFPMFGLFYGYVFLGEELLMGFFIGTALILSGVVLVNRDEPFIKSSEQTA